MTDAKLKVGHQIREARKTKKLTQKELGESLGVSESTVNQYESGKQNLTIDTMQKIADALGVELVSFFM